MTKSIVYLYKELLLITVTINSLCTPPPKKKQKYIESDIQCKLIILKVNV